MTAESQASFEDLYRELEATVRSLEAGDLPLADALALFEQGARLADQCNALLDHAELRVRQLVTRADGEAESVPFDGWQDSGT